MQRDDVQIIGTTAFLSTKHGIEAVDITNPSTPLPLSALNWFGAAQELVECGESGLACAASTWSPASLRVLDITDPGQMQVIGYTHTPGLSRSLSYKHPNRVYTADGGAGVSIIDMTNPASPERIGRIKTPGLVTSVLVSENRLFAALVPFGRIRIYDISNEDSPELIGEFSVSGPVEAIRPVHCFELLWKG